MEFVLSVVVILVMLFALHVVWEERRKSRKVWDLDARLHDPTEEEYAHCSCGMRLNEWFVACDYRGELTMYCYGNCMQTSRWHSHAEFRQRKEVG